MCPTSGPTNHLPSEPARPRAYRAGPGLPTRRPLARHRFADALVRDFKDGLRDVSRTELLAVTSPAFLMRTAGDPSTMAM